MFITFPIIHISFLAFVCVIIASDAMEDDLVVEDMQNKLYIDDELRTQPMRGNKRKSSLNILVADDNPVNLKVIARHLDAMGDDIVTVENGLQAVEAMQNNKFDVLLSDGEMPVMDGPTAIEKIRDLDIPQIPMFILTANTKEEFIALCRSKGVKDVLFKPITLEILKVTLEPYRHKPTLIELREQNSQREQPSYQRDPAEK